MALKKYLGFNNDNAIWKAAPNNPFHFPIIKSRDSENRYLKKEEEKEEKEEEEED